MNSGEAVGNRSISPLVDDRIVVVTRTFVDFGIVLVTCYGVTGRIVVVFLAEL
ncbi:MAG TPA: hypothetical protein VM260_06960 [Pirellula sp.]|nr:hypothetical protein [Pirellula sp.]